MDSHHQCKIIQEACFVENDKLRMRVTELEAKNADFQDEIEGLKQTIGEKNVKINKLEDQVRKKDVEIVNLQTQAKDSLKKQIAKPSKRKGSATTRKK